MKHFGMHNDDIILFAPTRTSMQRLLNICEDSGREHYLIFNVAKSETIFHGTEFGRLKLLLNGKHRKESMFFSSICGHHQKIGTNYQRTHPSTQLK